MTDGFAGGVHPAHGPDGIQPHGVLLVLALPSLTIEQASANTDALLRRPVEQLLGTALDELLGAREAARLRNAANAGIVDGHPIHLGSLTLPDLGEFDLVAHRLDGHVIVELEPAVPGQPSELHDLYPLVRTFVDELQHVDSIDALGELAVREVRRVTGFDRVVLYRFDADWSGQVVAESRSDRFPSLLDHWFPASDIPGRARELFRVNRWRVVPDADYSPVPVVPAANPAAGRPIDLTHASLRGASPAHLERLRGMGARASLSISVMHEGRLWGLVFCHHSVPRRVPPAVRSACDFLGQTFALRLAAKTNTADYEHRIHLKSIQTRLLASMAEEEPLMRGLAREGADLLEFGRATGVAVLFQGECTLVGTTPDEAQVQGIVDWLLRNGREEVFHTDALSSVYPGGAAIREAASGLLSISLSEIHRSFVLWFRPEAVRTVRWGGDPPESVAAEGDAPRHSGRRSLETWRETVRGRSRPWSATEIEAAEEFRRAIVGIVLRKAEELAELSAELRRSNQELEAFSYSVSHDLRAPFRHIVGYAELLRERLRASPDESAQRYIDTIVQSAHFAGQLVDNLLAFSQIGRASLQEGPVDLGTLVEEVRDEVMEEAEGRRVEWRIEPLPMVEADLVLLRQAVRNLLANAVKYTRGRTPARIEIWSETDEREVRFAVRDNGVGFEMQYADKLFGVFQRLHRMEDFEGTGIGLANVRRIITRHGGDTWATGAVNAGATFYFSLPRPLPQPQEAH